MVLCNDLIIIMNFDYVCDRLSHIFADGCVVFSGCVNIFMSQHIGDNVDVFCFSIQICAKSGTKFVWRDFFQRASLFCKFFDEIFHCTDTDSFVLKGDKHGVFIFVEFECFSFSEPFLQGFCNFSREL